MSIVAVNDAPTANAGTNINVEVGMPVTLDGSASFDIDIGDTLDFSWRFVSVSTESGLTDANIINANTPSVIFTPDVSGDYQVELTVSDGLLNDSAIVVVMASSPPNIPPNAVAGTDQAAQTGTIVTLDGSASSDPDNGPQELIFSWFFNGIPAGSALTNSDIANANERVANFTPDTDGEYSLMLEVFDGDLGSQDQILITAQTPPNVAPNADAGQDQNVSVDFTVNLDGSDSNDPDGGPDMLRFNWTFVSIPAASALTDAGILNQNTAFPSFIPDVEGTYLIRLNVFDGEVSDFDQIMVRAIQAGSAPLAPVNLVGRAKLLHVNINWDDTDGATNYRVFRRLENEGDFVEVGQIQVSAFIDDFPLGTALAEYFIVAENDFGDSPDSEIIVVRASTRVR